MMLNSLDWGLFSGSIFAAWVLFVPISYVIHKKKMFLNAKIEELSLEKPDSRYALLYNCDQGQNMVLFDTQGKTANGTEARTMWAAVAIQIGRIKGVKNVDIVEKIQLAYAKGITLDPDFNYQEVIRKNRKANELSSKSELELRLAS